MIQRSGLCRKPVGCKPPSRRSVFIHSLLPSNWKTPSSRSSSPLNTEPNGSFDLVSRANDAAMTCAARHPNPLKQMDANEVGRGLGCGNCANCRNRGFAVFESLETRMDKLVLGNVIIAGLVVWWWSSSSHRWPQADF